MAREARDTRDARDSRERDVDRDRDRSRGRDRDEDRDRGRDRDRDRGRGEKERVGGVSLDDDDAIDVGLFGAGRAVVKRSEWQRFDYGGMRNPPVVWLVTYERGEGKDKTSYEQPYGIGKGWDRTKQGEIIALNGQTGLPKTCNAIRHLVKPDRKSVV